MTIVSQQFNWLCIHFESKVLPSIGNQIEQNTQCNPYDGFICNDLRNTQNKAKKLVKLFGSRVQHYLNFNVFFNFILVYSVINLTNNKKDFPKFGIVNYSADQKVPKYCA